MPAQKFNDFLTLENALKQGLSKKICFRKLKKPYQVRFFQFLHFLIGSGIVGLPYAGNT
jgi:hypothetical protein